MTRAIRLKESYRLGLAFETTETANRYRQGKQNAAWEVSEANTLIWEEFGEAMKQDFRLASKRFWKTVSYLIWGKQRFANTVYMGNGMLLTFL